MDDLSIDKHCRVRLYRVRLVIAPKRRCQFGYLALHLCDLVYIHSRVRLLYVHIITLL